MREWGSPDISDLLRAASREAALRHVVDLDLPIFLPPGDMCGRVTAAAGLPRDAAPAVVARCIVDSLAYAHRKAIEDAVRLSGRPVEVIHLIGGGSRNDLLCQATADACGLTVVAGPAEATAIGNALVQARAVSGRPYGLAELRAMVRASFPTRTFHPQR